MRPGLTADDIYIMVEDEFHAVAQTFTKHLHHAEYVRLKNAAKNRNASTISSISRPVDSITTMREETKRKKEAEARALKMKAAVDSINGSERTKRPADDESDVSDFENDKQDEPWQGTQLQRFMTTSRRRNLTGWTGLEGVRSHTRAAAGFSKPEQQPVQPARLFESAFTHAGLSKARNTRVADASPSDSDSDSDDLDAPSRAPLRSSRRYPPSKPPPPSTRDAIKAPPLQISKPETPKPLAKATQRSFLDMTPRASRPSTTMCSNRLPQTEPIRPPCKDTEEMSSSVLGNDYIRRRRLKAKRKEEQKERAAAARKKPGSGIGVDEIPIFIV